MTVKERLKFILKQKGIKPALFCREIGVSKGYINSIRNSISPSVISRINEKFGGEIDTFYLLTGKDPKSREVTITTDSLIKRIRDEERKNIEQGEKIVQLIAILKEKDETIRGLRQQIEKMQTPKNKKIKNENLR